ncbi:hypothetical protein BJ085DRAFT_28729 [Dimargaris cristalligena]|uniref:Reverse transcriptase/retrotransposon-derived protein RNase H-like domain-containing protein n=1 Tax=Dimargaris cristalligena TaxID=215637 RepID=A0A4P9ZKI6_9FUNG|nr:hypothetical protein BJ085DRAFT_28729 [Dimargaris cristalligena]|eukprot:RKP33757.1 hypothetical protein BJ085DRAFT_28729 [Dimargaris cristalligena]
MRLAPEVRDFWTFEGGSNGRVRAARLVQGNSQSPAIVHALLLHVFNDIPSLRGRLLGGDVQSHIHDIGALIRGLASWGLTVNLSKSEFAGTRNVEILGYRWSQKNTWTIPDHRIADLQQLPMLRTVKDIQRLTGGVNAISAHLPWAAALLAPFYALTGLRRLNNTHLVDLKPHWDDLKEALLDTKHLYEPRLGEPLTLWVDAAEAGVGAVLLAHPKDQGDRVVAYFSKAFDGQQGQRHPGFREAWGLVRAARHFYTYLDGTINLRIEVDATTALGIFNHKDTCQADELAGFRAELAKLGIHSNMIYHRPGETHLTADWLSQALHRQRLCKPTKRTVATLAAMELASNDPTSSSDGGEAVHISLTSDDEDDDDPESGTTQHLGESTIIASLPNTWHWSITPEDQKGDTQLANWHQLCQRRDVEIGNDDPLFTEPPFGTPRGQLHMATENQPVLPSHTTEETVANSIEPILISIPNIQGEVQSQATGNEEGQVQTRADTSGEDQDQETTGLNTSPIGAQLPVDNSQEDYDSDYGSDYDDSEDEEDQELTSESDSGILSDAQPEWPPLHIYSHGTKRQASRSPPQAKASRTDHKRLREPSSPTLRAFPHLREKLDWDTRETDATNSEDEQLPWSIVQPGEATPTQRQEVDPPHSTPRLSEEDHMSHDMDHSTPPQEENGLPLMAQEQHLIPEE